MGNRISLQDDDGKLEFLVVDLVSKSGIIDSGEFDAEHATFSIIPEFAITDEEPKDELAAMIHRSVRHAEVYETLGVQSIRRVAVKSTSYKSLMYA